MSPSVFVYDPTVCDEQSKVRGVGRYLQILKENFPQWTFTNDLTTVAQAGNETVFINPFLNPFQSVLIKKKIAQKMVVVIHDLIPLKYSSHFPAGIKGRLNLLANKKALSVYDFVITDSAASKNDIKERLKIPETKIQVIYPCLPKIFAKEASVIASGARQSGLSSSRKRGSNKQILNQVENDKVPENYFLYVGDATWNKNLINLARAIKSADATCVFVGKVFGQINQLVIAENAWQKELVEFFQLAKGDPRFVFPGFVTDEELIEFYKNSLANILVSRDEGFGFSYLEAASQGTPSLLSDIAVLHEISQDAALFVDEEKPDEIAEKIKALAENEELRQTLGEEARERSRFFSSKKFTEELKNSISNF